MIILEKINKMFILVRLLINDSICSSVCVFQCVCVAWVGVIVWKGVDLSMCVLRCVHHYVCIMFSHIDK